MKKVSRDEFGNNLSPSFRINLGSLCNKTRLERYLLDVLDRGFADASQQWTVDQLLCHLTIMCNCLDEGTQHNSQTLNSISDLILSTKPVIFIDQFSFVAHIFEVAKNHFIEKFCSSTVIYHWGSKNQFCWIDELATYQRTHVDLLHYYDANRNMWTVEVDCFARVDEKMNTNMFVSSTVNGVNIQLPVYTLSLEKASEIPQQLRAGLQIKDLIDKRIQDLVNQSFAEELRTLIREFHQKITQ